MKPEPAHDLTKYKFKKFLLQKCEFVAQRRCKLSQLSEMCLTTMNGIRIMTYLFFI